MGGVLTGATKNTKTSRHPGTAVVGATPGDVHLVGGMESAQLTNEKRPTTRGHARTRHPHRGFVAGKNCLPWVYRDFLNVIKTRCLALLGGDACLTILLPF